MSISYSHFLFTATDTHNSTVSIGTGMASDLRGGSGSLLQLCRTVGPANLYVISAAFHISYFGSTLATAARDGYVWSNRVVTT